MSELQSQNPETVRTSAHRWRPTLRPTGEENRVREIQAVKRRVPVSDLWTSWYLARIIAVRDLRVRYKQSFLGPLWLIFQPLGVLAGLIFAFKGVANIDTAPVPYILFALGSLSAWTLVQLVIASGTTVFVNNHALIRRVAFPRTALFPAVIASNLIPAGVILAAALIGIGIEGIGGLHLLVLPLIGAWLILLLLAVMFLLASLNVRWRDTMAVVPFWLQVGMFITPVGYPLSSAPATLQTIGAFNPLAGILEAWRWALFGTPPDGLSLIVAAVATPVLFVFSWWFYTGMETRFADWI